MSSPFHGSGPRVTFGAGPMTPGIKGILIACVAMFLLQALVPGNTLEILLGLSSDGLLGHYRLWQPVSYLFLHSTQTLFHLLFNMLMLWMFGTELERRWGTQAFLQYYLLCGIGAGLLSALGDPLVRWITGAQPLLSPVPTIGASGAIYGLLAAQAILYPNRMLLLFLLFPMRMRPAVLLMAAITFWVALSSPGSTVNHVAHLGGMLVGWLYLNRAWNPVRMVRDWRWRWRRRRYRVVEDIRDDDRYRFH